ncbi:MAG: shikimate kinase, partial [Synechococcus sp. BS307-5m-G39]|nr:shikimate kinase [Synechococcus sp. BS307-5m-G39]
IPDIFTRDGESGFRSLETQVLNAISQRHSLVVATGGGAVTRPENWGAMHQGIVIWLDVKHQELLRRLELDDTPRPLLQEQEPAMALDRLLTARRPMYAEADLTVVIDAEPPDEVADGILKLLPTLIQDPPKQRPD